jgi:predicted MFS family arabinose efflux permease
MSGRDMSRNGRFALAVLFAINLLNFFDRQLPGALAEPIRKQFTLSDTELGLFGTVFTLVYAAIGMPMGRIGDRWVRTRLISIGVAMWSLLTAASGFAWSFPSLVAARLGVGIGEATCAPASQSLIGDLFPREQRARALSVFMLGLPLGLCLAFLLSGFVGATWGWRMCFWIACIPGLLVAGLVLRVPEPVRGATDAPSAQKVPNAFAEDSSYRRLLKIRTLWWIIASGALHNFNMYAINSFQTPFLQRYHGLGLREANMVSSVVLGAVGVIGLIVGGWAADRWAVRRADGRLLLGAIAMLASVPCVSLALTRPPGALSSFMTLMAIGTAFAFVYYSTVYAAIQDVVEPRLRASAIALYFFAMYVLGASLGTLVTGALSDSFARRAMSAAGASVMAESFRAIGLHHAMYVIPVLALICAAVLFAASRTIGADMQNNRAARVTTGSAAGYPAPGQSR